MAYYTMHALQTQLQASNSKSGGPLCYQFSVSLYSQFSYLSGVVVYIRLQEVHHQFTDVTQALLGHLLREEE